MKRQKCEIYSRVVGFLTPVSQWNKGEERGIPGQENIR